jgi:8-oxo-dGTP pyrophosphatase MutT (NUDIX family)
MGYFKIVPTSHLILMKDGKILMLRRFNTGFEDGNYSIAAGPLDGNETFIQAMIREAKEEAGLDIRPEDLEVIHVMHRGTVKNDDERVDLFIRANKWEGEPKNMEPDKCDDMRWVDIDNLPENTIPYIRQAITLIGEGKVYSEEGW